MYNSILPLQAVSDHVTHVWTPGHSHIHDNEMADQIAKKQPQNVSQLTLTLVLT